MDTVTTEQASRAAEALADEIAALALAGAIYASSRTAADRAIGSALISTSRRLISIGFILCADRTD